MDRVTENVIEFIVGQKIASVTFSQKKYVNRIKKLAKERPTECSIVAENQDGSIFAHIPTRWIRINPGREMTEAEEKEYWSRFPESYGRTINSIKNKSDTLEDN